jgi:diguanylate cyclase (GGDEF)-like protein
MSVSADGSRNSALTRSVEDVSWQSFGLAAAYAVPVVTVIAALTWWPGSGALAVGLMAALVMACQVLLFWVHLRTERSAWLDPLTGLPGRSFVVDRMRRALAGPAEVGLVFVDLDRFKAVNDTFGHVTGDRVLIETARRLCRLVPAGSVVARYGGDEFAVLVQAGPAQANAIAGRVETALRGPVGVDDGSGAVVTLSASVGTATAVGGSVDELLATADQAMYQAKRATTGIRTAVPNAETAHLLP